MSPPTNPPPRPAPSWGPMLWLAAAAVFLVFVAALLRQPVRWLLGYVADDAFYYLQTARHIAATGRPTFDGLNPTNGYHPGWMLLMVLCAKLAPGREALLRACLGAEFAFLLGGSLLLARALTPHLGADWAWAGAACWLLNPFPAALALSGVEAPLVICGALLVVCVWQARIGPRLGGGAAGPLPVRDLACLGLAAALAVYARTDQVLLALAVAAALLVGLHRRAAPDGEVLRALAVFSGTVALALAPWLLYSLATVGTVQQDSGAMKSLWHQLLWQGRGAGALGVAAGRFVVSPWLSLPASRLLALRGDLPASALPVTAALLAAAARRHARAAAFGALTLWALAFVVVTGLIYGISLSDYQVWHSAVPAALLFLVLFGWGALAAQSRVPPRAQAACGALALAAALGVAPSPARPLPPPYPWQRDVYDSLPRFNALVPVGARIGSLNAGIPAYFSDRAVVNLDGLVNHTAVAYWRRGEFDCYLHDQRIAYIADEAASLARAQWASRAALPLHALADAPLRGWDPPVRVLWRVDLPRTALGPRAPKMNL